MAVNRGLRQAKSPWIAILNNDVELAEDWAARLIEACERQDAWFATGKILSAADPTILDGTFDLLARSGCAWRAGSGQRDGAEWNRERPIRFAPLTAALFRAEVFERAGYLDQDFGSYLEDVELGVRIALEGLGGVYAPQAVCRHSGSATLGRWNPGTVRSIARNQVLLASKHFPQDWFWQMLAGQALWGGVALRHRAFLAYLNGKRSGLEWIRGGTPRVDPRITALIEESEAEMRELQGAHRAGPVLAIVFRNGGSVMPEVAIVIVAHNSERHIGACLEACAHVLPAAEVCVVDNASLDATVASTRPFASVRTIANPTNRGFAAAVNQGVAATTAPLILLLNPDTYLESGIDQMMAECRRDGVGGAGGRLTASEGRPQAGFMVRRFPTASTLIFEALGLNRLWPGNPVNRRYRCLDLDLDQPADVDQPAGAFLMFRRDAFSQTGGFDERFFPIWFEDVDFCLRLRNAAGESVMSPTLGRVMPGRTRFVQFPGKHESYGGMLAC